MGRMKPSQQLGSAQMPASNSSSENPRPTNLLTVWDQVGGAQLGLMDAIFAKWKSSPIHPFTQQIFTDHLLCGL